MTEVETQHDGNSRGVVQLSEPKPWWIELLQRQGLAVVIVLLASVYFFNSALPFVQKTATDLITWHKETVNKLQENSDVQTKTNKELVEQQRSLSSTLNNNSEILKNVVETTKKLHEEQIPVLKRMEIGIDRLGTNVEKHNDKLEKYIDRQEKEKSK